MLYNLPNLKTKEDCEKYFPSVLVISDYNTYKKFDELYYKVYYAICACLEIESCKEFKIKFKFYDSDEEIYSLSMPKFLLNLNAWRPLIELNKIQTYYSTKIEILDQSFIVSTMMSNILRVGLETKVLKILNDYGISFERSSELIKTVIERYQEISIEFALIDRASIMTLENIFLKDYTSNEKIRELNNLAIPDNIQTSEVDTILKSKMKELINEFGKTKNPLWYISKAGKHIKERQLQELFISYGQIPDVSGNVIPYTMKGNGLSTGYTDVPTYYIAATGARLSAIMNKEYMGKAGYFSRNLVLISRTLSLSNKLYDCGTKHMLKLHVSSNEFLRRLENKWYCEHLGDPIKLIHYETDKHLVGKTIYIRSLITCAGGDEACHVCYGNDSHLVMNMPGMGIFNTEVYSAVVSQNILSTKHLLTTNAVELSFKGAFDKYFKYISGDIYLKEHDELGDNNEELTIRIPEENVIPINYYDMIEYNTFGNNIESPIYVYHPITKEYEAIEIADYKSMFIDSISMKFFKLIHDKKLNKKYFEVSFDTLSNEFDGRLLSVDIKNNGLTDSLYDIMNLVNKNSNKYDNYNELAQYFFETLIKANINCRHVQGEIILNRLIRDADNIHKRPDFKKFENPKYQIITLYQALLNTDAPTIGMSFQEIKRQLTGNNLYEKSGESYLDPLYATEITTERFKNIVKKLRGRHKNG